MWRLDGDFIGFWLVLFGDLWFVVFDIGFDVIINVGDLSIVEDDINNGDVILDDDNIIVIDVEILGKCNEEVGEGLVLFRILFLGVVFGNKKLKCISEW